VADNRSLHVLLAACHAALRDARTGLIQLVDAVPMLERLCARLQAELDAETVPG
jgi:hypothetical protein